MAATANWRCADCDTFNNPAEKTCTICGSTRRAPAPAPAAAPPRKSAPRPAAKRPSPARPAADWRCTKCDTNNGTSDTSCVVCGTSWKAATKPAAKPAAKKSPAKSAKPASGGPAKPAPKRPTPKKTTSSSGSSGSSAKKTAPKRPAPKRPSSAGSTGSPRTASSPPPEGLFRPPPTAATGYTPTVPRPVPPPPPPPGPRWTPPPARAKKSNGCVNCLGALVMGTVLLVAAQSCMSALDSGSSTPDGSDTSPSAAGSCPTRIADKLPSGDGAELVEAFRTTNKQITLCRTSGGKLYYFGEFSDHREPGIAMPAERTSDGYEASNPPYRYDIHDGVVTIYKSGTRIGQEELTSEPSPE